MVDNNRDRTQYVPLPTINGQPVSDSGQLVEQRGGNVHTQHKHKNSRNRNHGRPSIPGNDGAVSDSVVAQSRASPKPKKAHGSRQASGSPGPAQAQSDGYTGHSIAPHPRPASTGAGNVGTPGKDPIKEAAYAGATFQASPAASSLPVPKFFSKSVPNVAVRPSLQGKLAGEMTPEASHSSPEPDVVGPAAPPAVPQSPLDLFFQADRAEKEKLRKGSNLLSPQSAERKAQPMTEQGEQSGRYLLRGDRSIIADSDEDDGDMPSPSRMSSRAHAGYAQPQSMPGQSVNSEDERRRSQTQSLKDMLLNVASTPTSTPPYTQSKPDSNRHTPDTVYTTPSPLHRSTSGPTTKSTPSGQPNNPQFHYGNRNLSPLFKAARSDSPTGAATLPPSGLRRQLPHDDIPNAPNFNPYPADWQSAQNNNDTRARQYLDQQIRASAPAEMPQLPFLPQSGAPRAPNANSVGPPRGFAAPAPSPSHDASGGPRNIKNMEDDLRRMLKLDGNALS